MTAATKRNIKVGITPEEHEKVAKILSDNKIATRELLKRSLDANSYDYISATYLLLAEQVFLPRVGVILVKTMSFSINNDMVQI